MAFDITSVLKGVSGPDTGKEQIEYIPVDQIDPDPNNFYSLEGLDELAGNIELIGLQQPLRVRPGEDGRFIVVSGHRRRAAILMIRDGGNEMFRDGIPCIVDRGEESPAMRELRLIYANASTRVMGPAEISKQAERTEMLLYQLKEEGVIEFPGRMRDHVAEACRISKTKLARLHAIRHNLVPELLEEFDAGHLNESVAYRMSQEKPELQMELHEKAGISVRGYDINATERAIEQIKNPRPAPSAASNEFQGKWEADRQRIRDSLERQDDDFFEMLVDVKDMFLKDLFALNSRAEGIERLKTKHGKSHHGGGGGVIWDFTCKPTGLTLQREESTNPITRSWTEVYDLLCTIALNAAADDAREGRKMVSGSGHNPAGWSTGDPPAEGRYLCTVDLGNKPAEQKCDWKAGQWTAYGRPVDDVFKVIAWYPLPDGPYYPKAYWDEVDDADEEEEE